MKLNKIWNYISDLMDIRSDANIDGTVKNIKDGIEFKGTNVWVLICSIILASVGLNINAVGVIIGAMLIAPLMGPILGIGLSVGINDFNTLKKSLKAFGTMTAIGLVTSTIFFILTPIKAETSEILGRTSPTFLDALVAFFGGMAGIVGGSRKEKSNIIPGVAIATALMPPLCTVGYGIATGNLTYAIGAAYLFTLNSVLIALATYLGVKYLRIPVVHQNDAEQELKVKKMIGVFIGIVLIPSAIILYNVTKESLFKTRAEDYISNVLVTDGSSIINQKLTYDGDHNKIEVFFIGETIPKETISSWKKQLSTYNLDAELVVVQSFDDKNYINGQIDNLKFDIVEDIYTNQNNLLKSKETEIKVLNDKIDSLTTINNTSDKFDISKIEAEIKLNYPHIKKLAYGDLSESNTELPTVLVKWSGKQENKRLAEWLKLRLEKDTIRIINY